METLTITAVQGCHSERSEESARGRREILRCAQNDRDIYVERISMLIETVAYHEKTATDILSSDYNHPGEQETQDREAANLPVHRRFHTFKQILRFTLAGGLNTLVDLLILNGLLWLFPTNSSGMLLAYNALAYSTGAINSFLLNKYWTFGQKQRTTRAELVRFSLITLCGIAWSSLILWLASRVLHPL